MTGRLSDDKVENLLLNNSLGRIGCSDGSRIYVVPVNYVYHENHILIHSVEGMKIQMMRSNPDVCFEVDEIKSFTNWESVIAWGKYQELTDSRERYNAMQLFVDRTLRLKISETAALPGLKEQRVHPRSPGNIKPIIYRIVLSEKTGRYETD
ncbi:MAG: pyridoxamine 5'-phosphate oxidase family protein [Chitinophagaceae bacterium]